MLPVAKVGSVLPACDGYVMRLRNGGYVTELVVNNEVIPLLARSRSNDTGASGTRGIPQVPGVMRMLDHPNIVKLYETFEDLRNVYLVMELCTGGELFERIAEVGNFTEKVAARLVRQMISPVYYMHSRGVVHRDLKPENFMFSNPRDVTEASLKIIDFGVSKRIAPGQVLRTRACTPYYVAPEVLSSKYTNTCDMWSIGVIAYILLCGSPPFYGENEMEIIRRVRRGSFEFDLPAWTTVSTEAKDLIEKLLVLDPSRRLTAEQALHHPWIDSLAPGASVKTISPGALVNLNNFNKQNKLKRMALTVIARQIPEDSIEELRQMFSALDKVGLGDHIVSLIGYRNTLRILSRLILPPASLRAAIRSTISLEACFRDYCLER
ncbi:hypothetical protein FOZ63_002035 [Perkinsus olseni]|uniref:Protein kinase domain-containing protein n=2 Tax=Perkinsus olseni TaxID=32597 RepID=A0A7J6PUF1_PEROL|nr:hypothetical protein FOZ63_002035 [Perkinsus olseni]